MACVYLSLAYVCCVLYTVYLVPNLPIFPFPNTYYQVPLFALRVSPAGSSPDWSQTYNNNSSPRFCFFTPEKPWYLMINPQTPK